MKIEKRLELILDAAIYCRLVKSKGMPPSAYSKALREPIHFLWEKRNSSNKGNAAQYRSKLSIGLSFGTNKLRYDHAIPLNYVIDEILDTKVMNVDVLKNILENRIHICLITKNEDDLLKSLGLNSKMPKDWDNIDPLARYKMAKIIVSII